MFPFSPGFCEDLVWKSPQDGEKLPDFQAEKNVGGSLLLPVGIFLLTVESFYLQSV